MVSAQAAKKSKTSDTSETSEKYKKIASDGNGGSGETSLLQTPLKAPLKAPLAVKPFPFRPYIRAGFQAPDSTAKAFFAWYDAGRYVIC